MVLTWRKKKHRVMQKWKVDVRTEKMTNATRSEFLTTKVVKIRLILWRSCALAFDPLHFHSKTIEVFSFIATCERSALWILELVRRRLWNHFLIFHKSPIFLRIKWLKILISLRTHLLILSILNSSLRSQLCNFQNGTFWWGFQLLWIISNRFLAKRSHEDSFVAGEGIEPWNAQSVVIWKKP